MKRGGTIECYDNVPCVECGRVIKEYDNYYAIRRNPKVGGRYVHVHIECYERLLPGNNDKKSEKALNK